MKLKNKNCEYIINKIEYFNICADLGCPRYFNTFYKLDSVNYIFENKRRNEHGENTIRNKSR